MQRSINGPDKDWLSLDEAAAYMGIGASTLKSLVRSGKFPQGAGVTGNRRMWGWMDVVAYMHMASRSPAPMPDDETEDDESPPRKAAK